MNPEEFDELLACHALGALDGDERQSVEARLASDPEARDRLRHFEEAAMLAAYELGPPEHVWDRITRVIFPGDPRVPHPRRLVGRSAPPSGMPTRVLAGLAAAACVAALVTGIVLATTGGNATSANLAVVAHAAQSAPGARLTALRGPDGRVAASAVVLPNGSGYLTARLARLGPGRTYQLWAMGNATISLGVLGPRPGVVAFTLVGDSRHLAITDEAAPGVSVTQRTPSATGELPSI